MVILHKGIEVIDLALYLSQHKALIFSDFHIGYEEMLTSGGTLVPRFQLKDTITRLENIFKKIKTPINKIIINGDLKHEFGTISPQEWREILKLVDYCSKKSKEIIITKGNHDVKLTPIMKKRGIAITKNYRLGDILIAHGDSIDGELEDIKIIIIGHVHPAITIRSAARSEKFKCFVKGKYGRKTLIIQPSFNVLTEGTDIREGTNSPYITSINNAEIYVVGDDILYFGKVKDIK